MSLVQWQSINHHIIVLLYKQVVFLEYRRKWNGKINVREKWSIDNVDINVVYLSVLKMHKMAAVQGVQGKTKDCPIVLQLKHKLVVSTLLLIIGQQMFELWLIAQVR